MHLYSKGEFSDSIIKRFRNFNLDIYHSNSPHPKKKKEKKMITFTWAGFSPYKPKPTLITERVTTRIKPISPAIKCKSSLSCFSRSVTVVYRNQFIFRQKTLKSRQQRECRRGTWKPPPTRMLRRPISWITIPSNTFSMSLSLRFALSRTFPWSIFVVLLLNVGFRLCFYLRSNCFIGNWLGF